MLFIMVSTSLIVFLSYPLDQKYEDPRVLNCKNAFHLINPQKLSADQAL